MGDDGTTATRGERRRAVRLVFEHRGDAITLVSRRRVEMLAPAPQRLVGRPDERGYWVELRDAEGRPLYRRTIGDPSRRDIEVPGADGERLSRVPSHDEVNRFTVVVPFIGDVRTVSVVGAAAAASAVSDAGARDLASFDIHDASQEGA